MGEVAARGVGSGGGVQDDAGQEGAGFLVLVRLADLLRRVVQACGALAGVDVVGVEAGQRVEGGGRLAGHLEEVEDVHLP